MTLTDNDDDARTETNRGFLRGQASKQNRNRNIQNGTHDDTKRRVDSSDGEIVATYHLCGRHLGVIHKGVDCRRAEKKNNLHGTKRKRGVWWKKREKTRKKLNTLECSKQKKRRGKKSQRLKGKNKKDKIWG